MKALIIGLDGANWNILDDYVLENYMPNLRRIKEGGFSGILNSTEPPVTPAAWTSFITGCNPSTHGITGFQQYDCNEDRLSVTSASMCRVPNMWQVLSRQGYKVASINVPWTYPCSEVNGIMVAGYGCPGTEYEFTYPMSFKEKLLGHIPDYKIVADWDCKDPRDYKSLEANIKLVERSFEQRTESVELVSQQMEWDVLMVVFQDLDLMQHEIWSLLDPETRDKDPKARDRLFRALRKLDDEIGKILKLVEDEETFVVIGSDHGFGKRIADIRVNVILKQMGLLEFQKRANFKFRKAMKRFLGIWNDYRMPKVFRSHRDYLNLEKSKAAVIHNAINGYMYVFDGNCNNNTYDTNDKSALLKQLKKDFLNLRCPFSNRALFEKVLTGDELWGVEGLDRRVFGDLVLIPQPGYILRLRDSKNKEIVKIRNNDIKGDHRREGLFVFSGSTVKPGSNKYGAISNIAPTIYAALKAKVPNYVDGTPWLELFRQPPDVTYTDPEEASVVGKKRKSGEREEEEVYKKLQQLGYIE